MVWLIINVKNVKLIIVFNVMMINKSVKYVENPF